MNRVYGVQAVLVLLTCIGWPVKGADDPIDTPLAIVQMNEVDLHAGLINNMLRQIDENPRHKLHSILVWRRSGLAVERYYNGYDRHRRHDLRSATKSITALLTGIAVDRKLLTLATPVASVLPYPQAKDKQDINVQHLLTMSGGLDCNDHDKRTRGQEDRMYRKRDWVRYFLDLDVVAEPGKHTAYCTGGVVALGEVLNRLTGNIQAFAAESLFTPLGIFNYRWAMYDHDSKTDTGGHLELTPQSMIKIGILVAGGGHSAGRQLVSADWLDLATTEQVELDGQAYGFLWWLMPARYPEKEVNVIVARGNGGQTIFVVPEYDLVAAFTTGYYNSPRAQVPFQLFFNAVLPAVMELQPFIPGLGAALGELKAAEK